MAVRISPIGEVDGADDAVQALLYESYIGGGFADPEQAPMLTPAAVRSRGQVLVATNEEGEVVGTLTVVLPSSPACRLAANDEAEFHLLCVRPDMRGRGIGRVLVERALAVAVTLGCRGIVLWTQPAMEAAQRLYEEFGFRRDPVADFNRNGRWFLVYRRALADP